MILVNVGNNRYLNALKIESLNFNADSEQIEIRMDNGRKFSVYCTTEQAFLDFIEYIEKEIAK